MKKIGLIAVALIACGFVIAAYAESVSVNLGFGSTYGTATVAGDSDTQLTVITADSFVGAVTQSGGSIDGTTIGIATPSTGAFTSLDASGATTMAGAVIAVPIAVADTNAYTLLLANSGHVHIIPDETADSTFTMPAESIGLNYKFVYADGAADAQDWIIDTGTNSAYFVGGITQFDKSIATNSVVVYYSDGNSNSKIGVLTPEAGTVVELWCVDGTTWYVSGYVVSSTTAGVTFGDQ